MRNRPIRTPRALSAVVESPKVMQQMRCGLRTVVENDVHRRGQRVVQAVHRLQRVLPCEIVDHRCSAPGTNEEW